MTPADRPRLIVVAGPNGAGKTSVTEQLLLHRWMQGCMYVNPDNIARDEFGDWNDPQAVIKAANHAAELRERCLRQGENLAFETVLSAPDKLDFLQRAKQAGFFIRLFFIGTDSPVINAKRVAQRVMSGGHDVPITKIVARYTRSIANCAAAMRMADRAYIYDNSRDGEQARLLFRTVEGRLAKMYGPINPWAEAIAQGLPRETSPNGE